MNDPEREKFAMIPESLIGGDIIPGAPTAARTSAFLVYSYLVLRQGPGGRPVRGFRKVARATGLQERTVSDAAKALDSAGLIELDLQRPGTKAAVMKVVHNPAWPLINPGVKVGPTPQKARHDPIPWSEPLSRDTHEDVASDAQTEPNTVAQNATAPRSLKVWSYDEETIDALMSVASDPDLRCEGCLGLMGPPPGRVALDLEFCGCPY